MKVKTPKQKTCTNKACGKKFTPRPGSFGQKVCDYKCGLAVKDVNQEKAKKALKIEDRKQHLANKERVKTKADHARAAQVAFNAWVRLRDHGLPCVSCGTTADIQYAAGHYKPSGSNPELRFEPLNVHRQCNMTCNMSKSGNLTPYRVELIKRIGQDKVDWLEGPHEPKRYTEEDLKGIAAKYRALARELKKSLGL